MSHQERRHLSAAIGTIFLGGTYILYLFQKYGGDDLAQDFKFWSIVILAYIPIYIVFRILLEIFLAMANAAVREGKEDPGFEDERDKMIDLKTTKVSSIIFGIGFLGGISALALNQTPQVMFQIFLGMIIATGIITDLFGLYYHKRGF